MNIDKDALRKAAEAATKGQWTAKLASDGCGDVGIIVDGVVIAECFSDIREKNEHAYEECRANGTYIAATQPATVIALLDEIAALVADKAALEADATRYRWLRDYGPEGQPPVMIAGHWYGAKLSSRVGFDLDTAIDAALVASGAK